MTTVSDAGALTYRSWEDCGTQGALRFSASAFAAPVPSLAEMAREEAATDLACSVICEAASGLMGVGKCSPLRLESPGGDGEKWGVLTGIAVHESSRRQGLARNMIAWMVRSATVHGYSGLFLWTQHPRLPPAGWTDHGTFVFHPVGTSDPLIPPRDWDADFIGADGLAELASSLSSHADVVVTPPEMTRAVCHPPGEVLAGFVVKRHGVEQAGGWVLYSTTRKSSRIGYLVARPGVEPATVAAAVRELVGASTVSIVSGALQADANGNNLLSRRLLPGASGVSGLLIPPFL